VKRALQIEYNGETYSLLSVGLILIFVLLFYGVVAYGFYYDWAHPTEVPEPSVDPCPPWICYHREAPGRNTSLYCFITPCNSFVSA
jgi:hypothetical protein